MARGPRRPSGATAVRLVLIALLLVAPFLPSRVRAVHFTLDKKECLSFHVGWVGDIVHGNFVVVSADSWGDWEHNGVDLVVEDPDGYKTYSTEGQTKGKFDFMSMRDGDYRFCFTNKSPVYESVALEVFVGHQVKADDVAKDEHITPIQEKLSGLSNSVTSIAYEAKWFHAQSKRQNELAKVTTRKLVTKTVIQSLSLLGCGFLQVYLLRRLFEKKMGRTMV